MKKILLTLLFATNCHANNQLQEELNAKQSQLSLLVEQIMQKEELLAKMSEKMRQYLTLFADQKKKQLNSNVSDDELHAICQSEASNFVTMAYDMKHNRSELLFDETLGGESARLFKFYLISYDYEYYLLQKLITKWAYLSDEVLSIEYQIEKLKE